MLLQTGPRWWVHGSQPACEAGPPGRKEWTEPALHFFSLRVSVSLAQKEMLTSREEENYTCKTFPHLGEFTLKFVRGRVISKLALISAEER